MRYISLFSGIEAASVAWTPLGWQAVAFAEIEPFPCALLSHYYPDVPNLGDVSQWTQEQASLLRADLVVGGFPCQDLSVAGKRKGLRDETGRATRSGLFFDAMRIAEWSGARWLLVENVPGLFSSNEGRDFAAVVGEMAGIRLDVPRDGWRNTGVVAGPLGLVEWAVLDAQWFGVPQRRRRVFIIRDTGDWYGRAPLLFERHSLSGHPPPRRQAGAGVAGSLAPGAHPGGFNGQDAYTGHLAIHALRAEGFDAGEDGTGRGTPIVPVGIELQNYAETGDVCGTIQASMSKQNVGHAVAFTQNQASGVRRLTPRECERLQGFPDDYTLIKFKGKPAADGPRYRALGNSMAVPVMRWIGGRIMEASR